jgi:UDP-glucose 4-epimerase
MKILITGGLGYIGSHIAYKLKSSAIIIDSCINSSLNYKKKLPLATVYKKEISKTSLDFIFKKHNDIKAVIHLAGLKSVNESIKDPLKYYRYNFLSSLTLLESMKKFNIKKLIFSSSATVYGNSNKNPKNENDTLISTNPYGSTKLLIEKLIDEHAYSLKSFSCISLRYFNPIGVNLEAGLLDKPLGKPLNLMPILIDSIIKKKKMIVHGQNYNTKDGTCVRDYIHVDDLADAHLLSLKKLKVIKGHKKINIGLGKGISVLELINIFEKVNNIKVNYIFGKKRDGDAAISYADNNNSIKFLRWKPKKNYADMCYDSWMSNQK